MVVSSKQNLSVISFALKVNKMTERFTIAAQPHNVYTVNISRKRSSHIEFALANISSSAGNISTKTPQLLIAHC